MCFSQSVFSRNKFVKGVFFIMLYFPNSQITFYISCQVYFSTLYAAVCVSQDASACVDKMPMMNRRLIQANPHQVGRYRTARGLNETTRHFLLAISKHFFPRTNWKTLHLTEFFHTTSDCDGCDNYQVCHSAHSSILILRFGQILHAIRTIIFGNLEILV